MDELIRQTLVILRGMWQRRWIGLGVAWVVGIAVAVGILRTPDRYEASARIYVDTQSVLKPLMSGLTVQPNIEQQIAILSRTLISRPNVERLVRSADLDLGVRTRDDQDALVDSLMRTIQISRAGGDNLYTIAYRDTQPDKAKRVVQSLVQTFVESSLGGKRKDTDQAKKFIDEQILVYQRKLEEAENRLKEFKLRHMRLATADGKDYYGTAAQAAAELQQARLDLQEAENSRDALRRQLGGQEEPPPSLIPDVADSSLGPIMVPELDGRIESVKRNLDNLRQRFTDQHPDVQGAQRVLDDLQAQREREVAILVKKRDAAAAAQAKNGAGAPMKRSVDPVRQQLPLPQNKC